MPVTARNENGKPVDWWFMYKVPHLGAGVGGATTTGYEYVYYDSDMDKAGKPVSESKFTIDKGKGALNETLDAVFNAKSATTGWILYNDETPDEAKLTDDGNLGHTKGVIAYDTASKSAYWLLHSWPKFAEPTAKKDPTPMYGQTYLCVSISLAAASAIAKQMLGHQEPQTYGCQVPKTLPAGDPLHTLATVKVVPSVTAAANVLQVKTQGITTNKPLAFRVIAKNRAWNDDFWDHLVAPELNEDLDVETWIRGDRIPPVADRDGVHKTFDIKFINLGALGIHLVWPESHDHAKWAISKDENWVCVGDMNRMVSQRKRGGGTIAFQNQTLWRALSKTSFLLAPPGMTRDQAHEHLQATHPPKNAPRTMAAPTQSRVRSPAKAKRG